MPFRLLLALLLILSGCSSGIYSLKSHFRPENIPPAPDYSNPAFWAALPEKRDAADSVPLGSGLSDGQASAKADVFFIYPTIFTQKPTDQYEWNANAADAVLNRNIQQSTILNQATIFNGDCRVYSPYYRQAHYSVFTTENPDDKKQALDLAYGDVRNAFQYYLDHFNSGRPIVIASHSQGSLHAERLILEFFDGKPLQNQLVVAYIAGRAMRRDVFKNLKPVSNPQETGVWASWCTFHNGYFPKNYERWYKGAVATNPLSWNEDRVMVPNSANAGGVAFGFKFVKRLADAQSQDGLLWTNKPYVRGRQFVRIRNWHRADMNLYYMNIRQNTGVRVDEFLRKQVAAGQ